MRIFEQGTPQQRLSYGESVIMGGVRQSLEYYCEHFWKECRTVALVSDEFMVPPVLHDPGGQPVYRPDHLDAYFGRKELWGQWTEKNRELKRRTP